MTKALLLLVVLATFVASCDNKYKDPDPQAMGYDYYPIEIGDFRVYDVRDVRFFNNDSTVRRFQLRERVDTSFHDQTGQLVYKVIRSIRNSSSNAWLDDSVMTVAKTERMVLLTKDNTKYVKLAFPVKNGSEFIGDFYNVRQVVEGSGSKIRNNKEVYTYERVGESYELAGQIYPTTATVLQNYYSVGTKFDDRFEVYAEGIGLAHRVFKRLNLEANPNDGSSKIVDGHARHEILIEHGKL